MAHPGSQLGWIGRNPGSQQHIFCVCLKVLSDTGHEGSDLNNGWIYRLIQTLNRHLGAGTVESEPGWRDGSREVCLWWVGLKPAQLLILYFLSVPLATLLHSVSLAVTFCLITAMTLANGCSCFSQVFVTAVQGWLTWGIKRIQQLIYNGINNHNNWKLLMHSFLQIPLKELLCARKHLRLWVHSKECDGKNNFSWSLTWTPVYMAQKKKCNLKWKVREIKIQNPGLWD